MDFYTRDQFVISSYKATNHCVSRTWWLVDDGAMSFPAFRTASRHVNSTWWLVAVSVAQAGFPARASKRRLYKEMVAKGFGIQFAG